MEIVAARPSEGLLDGSVRLVGICTAFWLRWLGRSPTSSNAAALIFRVPVLIFEAKSHLHFLFSFYAAALNFVAVVRV